MATYIQGIYPQTRNIAQGETFVIYFRILPSELNLNRIDEVYAQTDEGIESNHLYTPEYGETMNVFFDEEDTTNMTTGDHHIRMWAIEDNKKYVLFETMVQINPAFPFTSSTTNTDYTYTNNLTKNVESKTITVTAGSSSGSGTTYQSLQTYPVFRAKLDQPWMFNPGAKATVVTEEGLKPATARVGDLCVVESGEEGVEDYLYICVSESPAVWRRIGERVFAGSYEGLVPTSTDDTQNLFLKGDGDWSKVGRDSVVEEDFILDVDSVEIDCDF